MKQSVPTIVVHIRFEEIHMSDNFSDQVNFGPLNNFVFSPSQFYIVIPPRWPSKKLFFFFIPYHLNTGGTVPVPCSVPFTFLFFHYYFYNYWCHEQDSQEPGQILYRPCGVVTAADAPCETPVASLYPNATCVFHTKLLSPVVRWVLGKQCIGSETRWFWSGSGSSFFKVGFALKSEKSKATRVGIKKPAQKNPPKKTQKKMLKKTHPQVGFFGFFWKVTLLCQ